MSRPAAVIPGVKLTTQIPQDLHQAFERMMWSPLQNCVPRGTWSSFISTAIRDLLRTEQLDLAPYLDSFPGDLIVRGHPEAIRALTKRLENDV